MPPFDGPRATLWVTRKPWNASTRPSSIEVGIETSIAFLHSWRTFTRRSSIPKTCATLPSWSCAIRNGFSFRCVSRSSSVAMRRSFPTGDEPRGSLVLFDLEPDEAPARLPGERRPRDEPQLVRARLELLSARVAAGDAEGVRAGEQVAQAREDADEAAAPVVEQHVEPRDGLHLHAVIGDEPPGLDLEHGRRRVGRLELRVAQPHAREERARIVAERDRPGPAQHPAAVGGDGDRAPGDPPPGGPGARA